MRTPRSRVRFGLVAAVATFGLLATACGDSGSNSVTTTAAPGGATGTTAAPLTGTPVKVGAIFTLSGSSAAIGERAKQGLEYWKQSVGDVTGINGRPVTLDIKDDAGTADGGVTAARQLINEDKVDFLIGPFLSGPSGSVVPLANQAKIININQSAFLGASDPTKSPYSFAVEFNAVLNTPGYLLGAQKAGAKKLGLLAVDNPLGASTIDALTKEAASGKYTVQLVAPVRFPAGVTDPSAQVKSMKDEGADAVQVTAVASADYIAIFKAMDELGWYPTIIGNSAVAFPEVTSATPPAVLKKVLVAGFAANMLEPLTPAVQTFRTGLKQFLKQDPLKDTMWNAATAFDSANLIKFAADATKSTDPDMIKAYLESNPYTGLKVTYHFSATSHEGLQVSDVRFALAGTFKDGTLQPG
jgi:branched-chain amino acid transport system substrate-binding protein